MAHTLLRSIAAQYVKHLACSVVLLTTFADVGHGEPLYFTSGTTIYKAESTTRAYSVVASSGYGPFTHAACDMAGNLIAVTGGGSIVSISPMGTSSLIASLDDYLTRVTCYGTSEIAVACFNSAIIKKVTSTGDVSVLGTLPSAVTGLTYDSSGDVYAITGNALYRVDRQGGVSFIRDWSGYSLKDLARRPDGNFVACGASQPVVIWLDPAVTVTSAAPYYGRNGIGSSMFPYTLSLDQSGVPAYLQGYSPFNTGSVLMYENSWITGGAGFSMETVAFTAAAVPEPSTYAMALAGLAYGGFSMWRRLKRA